MIDTTKRIIKVTYNGKNIPVGPAQTEEKDVNFYDYDGTLLYSYTLAEAQALTVLPDLPDHSDIGLDKNSQHSGWNWTLDEVRALTDKMNIGANYDTTDSNTHIIIELSDSNRLTLYVRTKGDSMNVDWGDGSEVETFVTETSYYSHTYSAVGCYNLTFIKNDIYGSVGFNSDNKGASFSLYDVSSKPTISEYEVQSIVKKVFWGYNSIVRGGAMALLNNSLSYTSVEYISIPKITTGPTIAQISNSLQRCRKLKAVVLPPLTNGNTFFENDNDLKFLSFPGNATIHPVFSSNYNLEKIYIKGSPTYNSGLSRITDDYSLAELRIDCNITAVDRNAFQNNYVLEKVKLPSTLTSLPEGCFKNCYLLKDFEIPSSVTSLGDSCFYGCHNIDSITIGSSITSIGAWAFIDCKSLQTITIPSTVTSIGTGAFSGCTSMHSVKVLATTPPTLGSNVFSTSYQKKIYVPYSADHSILTAYQNATNWATYASIMVEADE